MENCIFCKIAANQVQTRLLYEDERVIAFEDMHPKAPTHILITPRQHIASINDISEADNELLGHMINIAKQLAGSSHIHQSGYRLIFNTGPDAGQSVFHIHLHLLGGRQMPFRLT